MGPQPAQEGLVNRIGDTLHQATDRAAELVLNAMGSLGVRYKRGGESAETGFDCSGFVRAVIQQTIGLVLPRRAHEQADATEKIDKADLQPGDLVFFNTLRRAYSHVGIYVGEGRFIHAPRSGARVRVESMDSRYWQRRFNGARRVPATDAEAAPAEQAAEPGAPVIDSPGAAAAGGSGSPPAPNGNT
jgi:cell wall-associated NlpC family hydrolase